MDRNTLFEGLLSQSSSLDLAVDPDGKLLYVSPAMARALGLGIEQLTGKQWKEVDLPADLKVPLESCFKHVLEEKKSMTTKMGISGGIRQKHYECTISPIMDGNGNVGNIMASFLDITELEEERTLSAELDEVLLKLQISYDIDRVIPEVLMDMASALNADIATIMFQQEEYWFQKYVVGTNDSPKDSIFLEQQPALINLMGKEKPIFELNDPYGKRHPTIDIVEAWGIHSLVAIPLHVRGEIFGVLTFAHRSAAPPYGVSRKNHIRKLGAALSLAFSEDRYIWSRESDTSHSQRPVGITTIGMAVLDGEDFHVRWANEAYKAIVPEKHRGLNILQMAPYYPGPNTVIGDSKKVLRDVQASNEPFIYGCIQERNKNGVLTFWQVAFIPSCKGRSSDIICLLVDITDWERSSRKVARLITAIQEEQLQVRALLESVPVGAYLSNAEGHITEISRMGPKIWGENVPLPRNIEEYGEYNGWWPETGERLKTDDWPIVRAVRNGETVIGAIINYQSFDGKVGTVINSAAPIRNRQGTVIGAVEIDHDITEMKNLERNLEAAKAHLEAVINQMPAGVAIAEAPCGKITMGNTALAQMFYTGGRMPIDIQEYVLWGLLDPDDLTPLRPEEYPLAKAILEKRTVSGEAVIRRSNGKETTVLMSATPVVEHEGKTIGAVAIFTDISHQKEIEKKLEQQARDLAKFNADLQRFAYVTSNDLRESLKSITNYLNLLEKSSS